MAELFDTRLRAIRRDRAARVGPELFLYERAFADCLDRIGMAQRQFERALLIGCPDRDWPKRLGALSRHVEVSDPGPLFAERANGAVITENRWEPGKDIYDLVLAIGTLVRCEHSTDETGAPSQDALVEHAIAELDAGSPQRA